MKEHCQSVMQGTVTSARRLLRTAINSQLNTNYDQEKILNKTINMQAQCKSVNKMPSYAAHQRQNSRQCTVNISNVKIEMSQVIVQRYIMLPLPDLLS